MEEMIIRALANLAKDTMEINGGMETQIGELKNIAAWNKGGKAWEKIKSWFGFSIHRIADADSELSIAYKVTKASTGEQPIMREMVKDLAIAHPELIGVCEHAMFDKGYDSTDTICLLWDNYKIKPIIDIKNSWKDGGVTRRLKTRTINNVTYDYKGTVFCNWL